MMGMSMPETCWAVFKWQVINLRSCCICLVDSVECSMMMHGLANPKFIIHTLALGSRSGDFIPRKEGRYPLGVLQSCQEGWISSLWTVDCPVESVLATERERERERERELRELLYPANGMNWHSSAVLWCAGVSGEGRAGRLYNTDIPQRSAWQNFGWRYKAQW